MRKKAKPMPKLRQFRKSLKLSMTEFGKNIGISENGIYRWERGIKKPSQKNLKKLCDFYGVTIEQIL